jgi:two-component system cell cycle response regulator
MKPHALDILLVEDSRTQAELIRHAIEASGHRVRNARNGLQALEIVRDSAPSLVITDIMMPGLDGYALCRALKGEPATRRIPVIMLTTLTEPADIIRGIESGADNFLSKPFSPEALLERIDLFLRNGELHRSQMFDLLLSIFEENRRTIERLERDCLESKRGRQAGAGRDEAIRICAKCKKVQDERGGWVPVEEFLRKSAGLSFTHEFCGDCGDGLMRKRSGT